MTQLKTYHGRPEDRIRMDELFAANPNPHMPLRLLAIAVVMRALHPLGVHHWTRWMEYSPSADRFVDIGRLCRNCPVGRRK